MSLLYLVQEILFCILSQEVLYLFITANAGLFCFMAIKML